MLLVDALFDHPTWLSLYGILHSNKSFYNSWIIIILLSYVWSQIAVMSIKPFFTYETSTIRDYNALLFTIRFNLFDNGMTYHDDTFML